MSAPEKQPYLMARWGNRARSPEQIARDFRATLNDLARLDPLLDDWWSKERIPVRRSLEDLTRWVSVRRVKGPPPEQGYDFSVASNGAAKSG